MDMSIEQFLTDVLHIHRPETVERMANCGKIRRIKAKEILYYQGDVPDSIAFLINGIVRSFVLNEKGEDSTECFDFKPGWPVVPSIPITAPASVNVEASVDSTLILLPVAEVWGLIQTDIEVAQVYIQLLCQSMAKYVEFTRALMHYAAPQRYEWFLQAYGAINGQVSNKEIASFLNMSPVTLSKIWQVIKHE